MAPSSNTMRLTVHVLPLAEEDSHGPYRDEALAVFKGRKFALPVQLDDTIEEVWKKSLERYTRNYLSPAQASTFTIKVLQDAYDCDLDLSDTVSSLFGGESDPAKRMIKVVPSFVYREFSVPATSNLRPASARKRETIDESTQKRRHIQENRASHNHIDGDHDRPLPTTESESGDGYATRNENGDMQDTRHRSASGSVVHVRARKTGRKEFGKVIKLESPELGQSISAQTVPESDDIPEETPDREEESALERAQKNVSDREHEISDREQAGGSVRDSVGVEQSLGDQASLESTERGPESSTPEPPIQKQTQAKRPRKELYDISSSPEFIHPSPKRLRTYSSSQRTPQRQNKKAQVASRLSLTVQNGGQDEDLTPKPRRSTRSTRAQGSSVIANKPSTRKPLEQEEAHTPQVESAEQQSRPQLGGTKTPEVPTPDAQNDDTQYTRPSSLKKPSRKAFTMPPPRRIVAPPKSTSKRATATPTAVHHEGNTQEVKQGPRSVKEITSTPMVSTMGRERSASGAAGSRPGFSPSSRLSATPIESSQSKLERIRSRLASHKRGDTPEQARRTSLSKTVPSSPGLMQKQGPDPQASSLPLNGILSGETSAQNEPSETSNTQEPATAINGKLDTPKVSVQVKAKTIKRTPVPPPGQIKDAAQAIDTPPASKASTTLKRPPRRSEVPLPENVRARYSSETLSTPNRVEHTLKNASDPKATPVFATPSLPERKSKEVSKPSISNASASGGEHTKSKSPEIETPVSQSVEGATNAVQPSSSTLATFADAIPTSNTPSPDDAQVVLENGISERAVTSEDELASRNKSKDASWAPSSWDFSGLRTTTDGASDGAHDVAPTKAVGIAGSPSRSPSRSPVSDDEANSTRSSPAPLRQPARFLSRSPSPQESSTEDENEGSRESSPEPNKAASATPANDNGDNSSSSSSESDTSEEEDEDEDVEMVDATPGAAAEEPPSSAPTLPSPPKSLIQPAPSRPPPRKTEVPLPGSKSASNTLIPVPSSQSISQSTRRNRSSQFGGTIKEQLRKVRDESQGARTKKTFDPSSQSLGALKKAKMAAKKGKGAAAIIADDSSDDESSSSSSDDD